MCHTPDPLVSPDFAVLTVSRGILEVGRGPPRSTRKLRAVEGGLAVGGAATINRLSLPNSRADWAAPWLAVAACRKSSCTCFTTISVRICGKRNFCKLDISLLTPPSAILSLVSALCTACFVCSRVTSDGIPLAADWIVTSSWVFVFSCDSVSTFWCTRDPAVAVCPWWIV